MPGVQSTLLQRLHRAVELARKFVPQLPLSIKSWQECEQIRASVAELNDVQLRQVLLAVFVREAIGALAVVWEPNKVQDFWVPSRR